MTKLKELQDVFNIVFEDCPEINETTLKSDIASWDSLNHLVLVLEIETKFNVKLTIEQIESLNSVKDILSLID